MTPCVCGEDAIYTFVWNKYVVDTQNTKQSSAQHLDLVDKLHMSVPDNAGAGHTKTGRVVGTKKKRCWSPGAIFVFAQCRLRMSGHIASHCTSRCPLLYATHPRATMQPHAYRSWSAAVHSSREIDSEVLKNEVVRYSSTYSSTVRAHVPILFHFSSTYLSNVLLEYVHRPWCLEGATQASAASASICSICNHLGTICNATTKSDSRAGSRTRILTLTTTCDCHYTTRDVVEKLFFASFLDSDGLKCLPKVFESIHAGGRRKHLPWAHYVISVPLWNCIASARFTRNVGPSQTSQHSLQQASLVV